MATKNAIRKPKQLSLIKKVTKFGGSLLKGKRKEARPLSTRHPLHVILKSEKARGRFSFINHRSAIELAVARVSAQFHVKIYDKAVNNDHIHLLIYFKSRAAYKAWIRTLTAEIVRIITRRTKILLKDFFTTRPYSQIVSWGRHLKTALNYQVLNQMEYFGLRPKKSIAPKRRAISYQLMASS